jgi:hypothetical protein
MPNDENIGTDKPKDTDTQDTTDTNNSLDNELDDDQTTEEPTQEPAPTLFGNGLLGGPGVGGSDPMGTEDGSFGEEGEDEMSIPNTYGTGAGKPGSIGGQVTTGYTENNSAPEENVFLEPKLPAGTVWKNGEEKLHPTNLDHTNTPMPAQAFLAAKERGRICAQKQVKFLNKQYQISKDYMPR